MMVMTKTYVGLASWVVVMTVTFGGQMMSATPAPSTFPGFLPTQASPGRLHVDYEMKNVTREEGATIRLRCEITGDPLPRYRWLKDGRHILNTRGAGSRFNARSTHWGSRLKISRLHISDSGLYTCEAMNHVGQRRVSGYLKIVPGTGEPPTEKEKNWSEDFDGHRDDGYIISEDDEDGGRSYESRRPAGRRHDDTEDDSHGVNPRRHGSHHSSTVVSSTGQSGFCQPYRGYACATHINHHKIFVHNALQQSRTEEEVTVAVTLMARSRYLSERCGTYAVPALCLSAFPLCDYSSATFSGVRHLCRRDCESLQKDFCHLEYQRQYRTEESLFLPNCSKLPHDSPTCISLGLPPVSRSSQDDKSSGGLLLILVPSLAAIAIIIVIIAAVCGCQRRRKRDKSLSSSGQELKAMLPSVTEIPRSAVRVLSELGEGCYGKVYAGELSGAPVVVKVLSPAATANTRTAFQREMDTASGLHHPVITRLLGACVRDDHSPTCLVYESPTHLEDLAMYARRQAPKVAEVLRIATQLASGLEYLAVQNLSHGDVAARNVIIFSGNVRLSSFALSRDVHSADYAYHPPTDSQRPLRWMSPEALDSSAPATTAMDVWAFGVTVWEALSAGKHPYEGYSNVEVVHMIHSHQVLPCPAGCTARAYAVLVDCWQMEPLRRPSFAALLTRLRQILSVEEAANRGQRSSVRDSASTHSSQRSSGHQKPVVPVRNASQMNHVNPATCYAPTSPTSDTIPAVMTDNQGTDKLNYVPNVLSNGVYTNDGRISNI